MTWRRVPPVYSPVRARSLAGAAAAAAGLTRSTLTELRTRIAALCGARDVVLTDSGTSALVLALRAVSQPGDAVAFPAFACIDLTSAAIRAGVTMRLYDLDPATMSPDLDTVRAACARGVRAIVTAPLYGYAVDARAVAGVAGEYGVPVIEDAAQGAGAEFEGTRVGGFGDVSVLSFGRGKGMTTGAGGALLLRNPALPSASVGPAARGWQPLVALAAQWMLARPAVFALPASIPALRLGEMVYHDAKEPRAISAAAAYLLGAALAGDRGEVQRRRARAAQFMHATDGNARLAAVAPVSGAMPGFLRFAARDVSYSAVPMPRCGILRAYPMTLDEHPRTRQVLARGEVAGPGARALRDGLFTLPTHSRVTDADASALIRWLRDGAGMPVTSEASA